MKKNISALVLTAAVAFTSGCNPLENAFNVSVTNYAQSGLDFSYTVTITDITGGTVINNVSLSDTVHSTYGASVANATLMNVADMIQTSYDFSCVNDSGSDSSTHRYFVCKDQYFDAGTPNEHVYECLLEKNKAIPLAISFTLTTDDLLDSATDVAIGTLNN